MAPTNCTISNSTGRSLRVDCEPGDGWPAGAAPEDQPLFHLQLLDALSGRLLSDQSQPGQPRFTIEQPPTDARLRLRLFASNRDGRSQPVELAAHTLSAAQWRAGRLD